MLNKLFSKLDNVYLKNLVIVFWINFEMLFKINIFIIFFFVI